MTANVLIKKQAKEYLQGSWAAFAAAFFVMLVPLALANVIETVMVFFDLDGLASAELSQRVADEPYISAVAAAVALVILLVFVFSLPLTSGFFRMAAAVANGKTAQCSDLFYYYEKGRFVGTLGFNLSLALRRILWTLLSFVPAAICVCVYSTGVLGSYSWVLAFPGVILMTLGVVLSVVLNSRYFLAQYLYVTADEESRQAKDFITLSVALMKGNKKRYLSLLLSFLPWIALTFFILPGLYTVPYMAVSFADSAKWICGSGVRS